MLTVALAALAGIALGYVIEWCWIKLQASQLIFETESNLAYLGRSG